MGKVFLSDLRHYLAQCRATAGEIVRNVGRRTTLGRDAYFEQGRLIHDTGYFGALYETPDPYRTRSNQRERERLESTLKLLQKHAAKGANVLDVGCGEGIFTGMLREHGFQTTGIDISPQAIDTARKLSPGVRFLVARLEEVPSLFQPESFDVTSCLEVLYYLPNYQGALANLHWVTRKEGLFLCGMTFGYGYLHKKSFYELLDRYFRVIEEIDLGVFRTRLRFLRVFSGLSSRFATKSIFIARKRSGR